MSADIVQTDTLIAELDSEFPGLTIERHLLRTYFDRSRTIFFDCDHDKPDDCVTALSERTDLYSFLAFFLVKTSTSGQSPSFKLVQVTFRNSLGESLSRFIGRFRTHLEPATMLSLQIAGYQYQKCLGFSYSTYEEMDELERGVSQLS